MIDAPPAAAGTLMFRPELLAAGVDDNQIFRLIRAGILVRVRPGVYCARETWDELDARARHLLKVRAALHSCRCTAVASHASAAAVHTDSLWTLDLRDVHLSRVDSRSGRREAGIRQHRGVLAGEDVVEVDGIRVTSPTRTVLDLCSVVSVEQGLVVAEALLHVEATSPEALRDRFQRMCPWPGSLRTAQVLRLADGRNTTPAETRAHYLFFMQSLPAPIPQYEVRDENGNLVATVDFAWPELGVFVEFDGRAKYGALLRPGETAADAVYREKLREDRVRELTGWTCIRLTWADLERPAATATRIRRAFKRNAPFAH